MVPFDSRVVGLGVCLRPRLQLQPSRRIPAPADGANWPKAQGRAAIASKDTQPLVGICGSEPKLTKRTTASAAFRIAYKPSVG